LLALFRLTESNKEAFDESQRALLNKLNSYDGRPMKSAAAVFAVWPIVFDKRLAERVSETYGGTIRKLGGATIEGGRLLDQWAKERTDGVIEDLDIELSRDEQVFAASVATYGGLWEVDGDSRESSFETHSKKVRSKFSSFIGSDDRPDVVKQFQDANFSVVSYSLVRGDMRFHVIVPWEGQDLRGMIGRLDSRWWRDMLSKSERCRQRGAVPVIDLLADVDYLSILRSLGVSSLFDENCNLRPMAIELEKGHRLSRFRHVSSLKLSHTGEFEQKGKFREELNGVPERVPALRTSRPFVFAISDSATGVICFLGIVNDPTAQN
jgi:serine protease inhibitor